MCQHKPSSKDTEWEMSEEKETFAEGRSFSTLLGMCEIHRGPSPRYLLVCAL